MRFECKWKYTRPGFFHLQQFLLTLHKLETHPIRSTTNKLEKHSQRRSTKDGVQLKKQKWQLLADMDGVKVWPNVSSWTRNELRSRSPFTITNCVKILLFTVFCWRPNGTRFLRYSVVLWGRPIAWYSLRRVQSDVTKLNWKDTVWFLTKWPMGKQSESTSHWLTRT